MKKFEIDNTQRRKQIMRAANIDALAMIKAKVLEELELIEKRMKLLSKNNP